MKGYIVKIGDYYHYLVEHEGVLTEIHVTHKNDHQPECKDYIRLVPATKELQCQDKL